VKTEVFGKTRRRKPKNIVRIPRNRKTDQKDAKLFRRVSMALAGGGIS
jgi:hypothetical protein